MWFAEYLRTLRRAFSGKAGSSLPQKTPSFNNFARILTAKPVPTFAGYALVGAKTGSILDRESPGSVPKRGDLGVRSSASFDHPGFARPGGLRVGHRNRRDCLERTRQLGFSGYSGSTTRDRPGTFKPHPAQPPIPT